jgi:fused signal recognition particle receptor
MWILIAFVGFLLAVIIGVVLKSALRKPEKDISSSLSHAPTADEFAPSKTMREALSKTEQSLFGRLKSLISSSEIEKNFDEIEEILYTSDLGPQTVERLMASVREQLGRSELKNMEIVKDALKSEVQEIFNNANIQEPDLETPMKYLSLDHKPAIWMVVGVNGAGKTTSIGKIAAHLARSGKKVLVAAGDTFRAAAGNQLKVWTERAQVEIFSPPNVTDPSAVAFDAVSKAIAQDYDVVIIDTAGRLHTQANLMEELKKMKRVIAKASPQAPHETLIVLDANSGQNALIQAREFHQALGLTGVVLTKMDGTAKGGVAVGLANELKIPIRLVGVGEKIGDLRAFSAQEFVESIF